jgi:lipopolysaccharide biosynthesis glycosyltransferase
MIMDLNVVYASDNRYAQHVGVSMTSLFENNLDFKNINIYLIDNNISSENKNKLTWICKKYKRTIEFINFDYIGKKLKLNINNSISISSYSRLFLSTVLDESIEKVIYLDCDSIINGSLIELWKKDLSNYYVAGVCDSVSEDTKIKVNMDKDAPYINAGMLLINLKKWREHNIEEKFLEFIDSYKGQVFHHDQGTINGVLNEKIFILHPKYNAMTPFFTMKRREIVEYYGLTEFYSENELTEAIRNPIFVHFTPAFVNRPWIKGCKHPLSSLYKKYLDLTPWEGTKPFNDRRSKGEKTIAFLYNYLPFKVANSFCNQIFK